MALYKPKQKEFTSFSGVCDSAIVGFEDKSNDYDFADLILEVQLKQKGSDYVRKMSIIGEIEKDSSGNVTGGNFAKRLYDFFGVIGCEAGINIKGEWETNDGEPITDITEYLVSRFAQDSESTDLDYNYIAYFYKDFPKAGKPAYTKVVPILQHNNDTGRSILESSVKWRKDKGYLKEYDETKAPNDGLDLDGLALDNL